VLDGSVDQLGDVVEAAAGDEPDRRNAAHRSALPATGVPLAAHRSFKEFSM
jgi:hypothetical protein